MYNVEKRGVPIGTPFFVPLGCLFFSGQFFIGADSPNEKQFNYSTVQRLSNNVAKSPNKSLITFH